MKIKYLTKHFTVFYLCFGVLTNTCWTFLILHIIYYWFKTCFEYYSLYVEYECRINNFSIQNVTFSFFVFIHLKLYLANITKYDIYSQVKLAR